MATNAPVMPHRAADIQGVLSGDLYSQPVPTVDGVKQVLDTLKDRVQALSPAQMQGIAFLEHLQSRPIHNGAKPYEHIIQTLREESYRVAPPGFFIRVIEALIPRPISVDAKTAEKMKKEANSQR
ncbi:hypothetical protein KM868_11880 [Micrococcus luteus]|uniref:hypothetical protein n=1 Tax=Micrococcus luteus TaxID=1270 RepID=UPI001C22C8D9|nr:hypothetical protein [Micrococcus luteus]MBU8764191.1 hypothetical protein [Micrococcus luteus]